MLDKPVPISYALAGSSLGMGFGWGFLWQQTLGLLAGTGFPYFLLESLILAQDERWRRA